jgi:hypothetical protein
MEYVKGMRRNLEALRHLCRIHDPHYNMILHDCRSSCYAHLFPNLHTYGVVAAGAGLSSLWISPRLH